MLQAQRAFALGNITIAKTFQVPNAKLPEKLLNVYMQDIENTLLVA